ncbi:MAG: pantetheine-phosphate adenylyltransferase [Thermoproteota archaeon]
MREIIILGGTFDLFHRGHRLFLSFATSLGKKVIIGVTSDDFATGKHHNVESFELRLSKVLSFLQGKNVEFEVFKLDDFTGPSLSLEKGTLLTTSDTLNNSILINRMRKEEGKCPFEILLVPLLEAEDSKPISSSRIRMGEVDEEGYLNH